MQRIITTISIHADGTGLIDTAHLASKAQPIGTTNHTNKIYIE